MKGDALEHAAVLQTLEVVESDAHLPRARKVEKSDYDHSVAVSRTTSSLHMLFVTCEL